MDEDVDGDGKSSADLSKSMKQAVKLKDKSRGGFFENAVRQ